MKKWLLTSALVLSCAHTLYAQVVIDEIMYDVSGSDSGREWIEVINIGHDAFDFTKWKVFENEKNHAIKSFKGTEILSPNTIAVIADDPQKFLADHPDYPGILFESAFSLSNEGEMLGLKDSSLHLAHEITYAKNAGANGDGNSFQKIVGTWYAAAPTPGEQNAATALNPATEPVVKTSITVAISGNRVAGSPLTFTPTVSADNGPALTTGKITWNFGDGNTKTAPIADAVLHAYQFPGTYALVAIYEGAKQEVAIEIDPVPAPLVEKVTVPEKVLALQTASPEQVAGATTHEKSVPAVALAASAADGAKEFRLSWWIFALAGLVFLCAAIAIIFLKKPIQITPEDDFEIIE